jgi:2-hydroxychromene-2-carboxylate isomerase
MAVSTEAQGATKRSGETTEVEFYFDVVCPWAWRTSLWIREVAKVRPITLRWKFLSLEMINTTRPGGQVKESHLVSRLLFKVMGLARRELGEEAVDRLYLAFGRARHERKQDLSDREVVLAALDEAGLDRELLARAETDEGLARELEQEQQKIAGVGGFGVPTLLIEGCDPMFGPVINPPTTGEEAGEMWDHVEYFIRRPDFFELKRDIRR